MWNLRANNPVGNHKINRALTCIALGLAIISQGTSSVKSNLDKMIPNFSATIGKEFELFSYKFINYFSRLMLKNYPPTSKYLSTYILNM